MKAKDFANEGKSSKSIDRKADAELLKANISLEQFQKLINSSPIGIIIIGAEFKIEYANQSLASLLQYNREELIGKDFRSFLSGKGLAIATEIYQLRRKGVEVPDNYQIVALRQDNSEIHLDLTSSIYVDPDGQVKTIAQVIDITDRVETRIALKESKIKYEALVENSPYSIILSDLDGKLITVNPKTLELFGYDSLEDLSSGHTTLLDFVIPEDRRRSFIGAQRTIKSGVAGPFTYRFIRKDGSRFHGEVSGVVIPGEDNSPGSYMAIITDISERIQNQQELYENQQFISVVANTTPAMIHVFSLKEMKQLYINSAVEQLLGFSVDEMMEDSSLAVNAFLHPEDRERAAKHYTGIVKNKSDDIHEIIYRLKHRTGSYRIFKSYDRPFERSKDGTVSSIIGVSFDITDQEEALQQLKETSEKLSNMMRAANDGMWDWYLPSGKVVFDPRYYQMAGYEVDEFPHTLDEFQKRVHPRDLESVMNKAQDHLEGKSDRFIVEFRFLKKNNNYMWILGRGIIAERDSEGNPLRLMGTHTDITELKKIQNDLRKAKNKAEESDRLKSAFLANMSHEIRTPMNGILGFADLLFNEKLEESERKEYVKIIQRSGHRMLNTINDIIDLSKIEAGQVDLHLSSANINNGLHYLYEFFHPETSYKKLDFIVENDLADEKAEIILDHEKVAAILSNLLKNAIKYTNKGQISFGYEIVENMIQFYVKDTGIGINKSRQKAVFDRFVQEDLTITKAYEGSGLGLSISKGFVELMGGKIWLKSERDAGSEFYFRIPFEASDRKKSVVTKSGTNTSIMEQLKNVTILLVEDDESALYFLEELLKNRCKKILEARNGREAVELCKSNPEIDLILMDIKMPELDGFEATRLIREFNQKVIIIGQTAYALVGDKKKVIDAGCNDYITKPINRNELFDKIQLYI